MQDARPHTRNKRYIARRLFAWLWNRAHLAFPVAASAITLSSTHILFDSVINSSGDDTHHIMGEHAILHAINAGDNPLGPVGIDFGQPLLRFYQCLFYLFNIAVHLISDFDLMLVHNATVIISFALSPFAYLFFLRKLGLSRFAAALGSFVSMISVAAFGNSIEAYHQTGIVTQSLGGFFFPLFIGCFIGMLKGHNRASTTALFFALAFLSHAILSVFAVAAGVVYFLVSRVDLKRCLRRLTIFCLLGAALVSFWTLPFLEHTFELRPVPDSIIRGRARAYWFNSVSKDELSMILTTGRLLDDPRVVHKKQKDPKDKLMDKISMMGTKKTRRPVVSLLTALGALIALLGLRRTSHRFLLAGFAFSLMLFTGPDDFRWMRYLPFMKQIQPFRCTYLVEFFAFGLVGLGCESVLRRIWVFIARLRLFLLFPLALLWLAGIGGGVFWCASEMRELGKTHLTIRNQKRIEAAAAALGTLPERGYPYRVKPAFRSHKLYQDWFVKHGYQTYGTHWVAVGPSAGFHLAWTLGSPTTNTDLYSLAGIRYFSGDLKTTKPMMEAKDKEGFPLLELLPNGLDARKKPITKNRLLDSGRASFLRPLLSEPLPVVCNDAQWIWLAKTWTKRFGINTPNQMKLLLMRVGAGQLATSMLLESASAILYLEHSGLKNDKTALTNFSESGGLIISPKEIGGIDSVQPKKGKKIWSVLPGKKRGRSRSTRTPARDERNPAFEIATIDQLDIGRPSLQRFLFDVELLEPIVAVLPMTSAPGWNAMLDGSPIGLHPAGPNMMAVSLPRGAHRLVFNWKMPNSHIAALMSSLIALLVVALSWLPWRRLIGVVQN